MTGRLDGGGCFGVTVNFRTEDSTRAGTGDPGDPLETRFGQLFFYIETSFRSWSRVEGGPDIFDAIVGYFF